MFSFDWFRSETRDRYGEMVRDSEAYRFAIKIVEKHIQKLQVPKPKPVHEVSEMLNRRLKIGRQRHTTDEDSTEATALHGQIQKLLEPIKPYIFGGTPMYKALNDALAVFVRPSYTKVLFILSDGEATDEDHYHVAERLRQSDVTVVTCFLTEEKIVNQRCLFDPTSTVFQDDGKRTLFEMSSVRKNSHTPVSYLIDAGWELPSSGESRLFIQANSLDVVDEFCRIVVSQLENKSDAVVHLLEKIPLATYINQSNEGFEPKEQVGGTCYANAIAAVFDLAMRRIEGREGGYPDFYDIRRSIISEYGKHGANTEEVLEKVCRRYRLHFQQVDETGARQALNKRRPVIATFWLYHEEWTRWKNFYKHTPKEVLKRTDIEGMLKEHHPTMIMILS